MVVKRMSASAALQLVRKAARRNDLRVVPVPKRGKGSHTHYALLDSDDNEVRRFSVTGHPGDLSWKVLTNLEDGLADLLGNKWMEKR